MRIDAGSEVSLLMQTHQSLKPTRVVAEFWETYELGWTGLMVLLSGFLSSSFRNPFKSALSLLIQ